MTLNSPGRPAWLGPLRAGRSVDAVTDRLVTAIAVGDFSPGQRLPPERAGAIARAHFRITHDALRHAVERLARRHPGRGEPNRSHTDESTVSVSATR